MKCDFHVTGAESCPYEAVQYVQTWAGTLAVRCKRHRIGRIFERKDLREISYEEALVLQVQES